MSETLSLRDAAVTDFKLSFFFAQGLVSTQGRLLSGLHKPYLRTYGAKQLQEFDKQEISAQLFIPKLPNNHRELLATLPADDAGKGFPGPKQEFTDRWNEFRSYALRGEPGQRFLPTIMQATMIRRDIEFIGRRRETLSDLQPDPYASFFRQFVVLETPTGSPAFDEMMATIREVPLSADGSPNSVLEELEEAWTHHHPGESFWATADSPVN